MFGVLVSGVQTLTASPLPGRTDPNPGANPDPDHCSYATNGYQYYCTYGDTDCRGCYYWWPGTYMCNQVLCESTEQY